jgi:hypothetical protein
MIARQEGQAASVPSWRDGWVEALELDAGVVGCEAPVDLGAESVSLPLVGSDLLLEGLDVRYPTVEALAAEHREFDLGDVEPTAVLGSQVDLELVAEALGLGGWEGFVERGGSMSAELIHHQDDLLGLGMADIDEVLDLPRPIDSSAPSGHGELACAEQRLGETEDVGDTSANILVVVALGSACLGRYWDAGLADELSGHLIQADQGSLGVEGPGVDVKDILHLADELGVGLRRNHPFLLPPGSKLVCFKARRTVS